MLLAKTAELRVGKWLEKITRGLAFFRRCRVGDDRAGDSGLDHWAVLFIRGAWPDQRRL